MISRRNQFLAALCLVLAACAADDADTEKSNTRELASADSKSPGTTPSVAHAQPKAPGHAAAGHGGHAGVHGKWSHEAHAKKLQEKLGLTDEQTAKVEAAFAGKAETPMADRLEPILTEAQMVKLVALKAKHGGECGHGGAAKHGDCKHDGKHGAWSQKAHAKKLQEKLGLTDEQTAKVEAAFAGKAETPMADRLKPVLSADQYTEWQRLMKSHGKMKGKMHGKSHGKMHGKSHGKMKAAE